MTTKQKRIIGIDLGTTFSLCALLQDGVPVLIPNALGETLTPSAVSVDEDGTLLVGAPARARAATHPARTALAFKRDMGTERHVDLAGRRMRPTDLSAAVLGSLKQDAEAFLGESVEEAVITVPAYFGDAQRQATRDAAAIAGLRADRIVNEPTAAALAYGIHHREREVRCVVLDLGGGTFDVTVLEIIEGVVEIQSSAGDARLGGEDFTDALAAWAQTKIAERHGVEFANDAIGRARIREAAESLKRQLSSEAGRGTLAIHGLGAKSLDVELTLERSEAVQIFAPLMQRLRTPIRRALSDARMLPSAIEEVLLVGGATRMPWVADLATEIFARVPLRDLPPDEAVAHGAAIQAALVAGDAAVDDLVVTDVAPFTMGIESAERLGGSFVDSIFAPIIERGTVIPASREKRFSTLEANQSRLDVRVYQGEHSSCDDNVLLGEYVIDRLPLKPAGHTSVDVRFTYDLNGILEVEMRVVGTRRVEHLVVEKQPGRLSKAEIAAARAAMGRIKFHPRESLPNRTALAFADALFAELTGVPREDLGAAIAFFRAAVETQNTQAIDEAREQLVALTAALRR